MFTRTFIWSLAVTAVIMISALPAATAQYHSADTAPDQHINLSELLRVIQFFNSNGFHCEAGTEDGYAPGPGDQTCTPHDSDYNTQDWHVNLSELLRVIQFFNSDGYHTDCGSEDNFAPGPGSLFECGTEGEGGGEGAIEGEGALEGEGGGEGAMEGEGVLEGEGGAEGEGEGVEEGEGGVEGEGEGVTEGEGGAEGEGGGEGEGEEQPPVADFWTTATVGSVPFDVYFTDASIPGSAPIDSWTWDFGDGGTSTEQNVVHQYTTSGIFTVTLTVTAHGLSNSITQADLIWAWNGIHNVDELQGMRNDLTAMYRLENDIDASATAVWKGGFEPIGTVDTFNGIFDGQGLTISNLYINRPDENYIGLFGMANGAAISNVRLDNASITGHTGVGCLVGTLWNGSISGCTSSGAVSSAENAGGLIGEVGYASVTWCNSACNTTGSANNAGGFAGRAGEGSTISQCFATGTAHAGSYNAGGFAGGVEMGAAINQCYATGAASTVTNAGGFAGYCVQSTISDCFAMGAASGNQAGGLVGYTYSATITNCFSTGHPDFPVTGGGLIGLNDESKGTVVTNSYWDAERSGIGSSPFGTGKTTAEMVQQATFAGWDFANVWAITENESYPWLQALGGVPPVADFSVDVDDGMAPLTVQFTDASDGKTDVNIDSWSWDFGDGSTSTDQNPSHEYTTSGVYTVSLSITTLFGWDQETKTELISVWTEIHDVNELQAMNDNLSGSYRLANDIDASATESWKGGFVPIGGGANPAFSGLFDGQGFTISGLTMNWPSDDNVGLFGTVNGAEISNVNLVNGHVTGNSNVGGLVGSITQGSVNGCTSSGSVSGAAKTGGLIGEMSWTSVTGCSADCSVTSSSYTAGGLAGYATVGCTINQCFATGAVSSQISNAGGLVGAMDSGAVISQCFASGPASTETGVGGLAGTFSQSTMTDCFAMGTVSGNWAGGLIGLSTDADIANCFSTGRVYVTWNGGGLIGVDDYTYHSRVNNCYWDTDRSGMWSSPRGEGKTTAEMLIMPTFVDWDFANVWTNIAGETYPWLQALPTVPPKAAFSVDVTEGPTPLAVQFTDISSTGTDGYCDSWYWDFGDGSSSTDQNPVHSYTTGGTFTVSLSITTLYGADMITKTALISTWHEINDVNDLQDMNLDPAGRYFLSSDIDASATASWKGGFVPIGGGAYPAFSGTFDGQGHTITGLTIDWAGLDSIGLFGVVDGAQISSLNLADVHVTGGNYVGSLAGSIANASISNCTSTGSVAGASQVGGLCGEASDSEITMCSAACPVTGSADNAGGLVGKETGESSISLCYATGSVEAQTSNAGGLVGVMDAGASAGRS
ncbi:MAG TPA: PKD domain-containing protein, partial [Candidatus Hydrogenedentes bacterium]|nr:PKD domain-containing protein [Candidatus Hydrogenedentota bacterium]